MALLWPVQEAWQLLVVAVLLSAEVLLQEQQVVS
jgi:hypothetical protein